MESTGYITLPVSALKSEATRVFDALDEGRTVYVSKHGDIVAAFRPDVPLEIAAAYALPQVTTAELTARAMQQAAPTKAVNDAAGGLPSLVTRDRKVYGMLVPAELATASVDVPDPDASDARSQAMSAYLTGNPNASIEDIAEYREKLDAQHASTSATEDAGGDLATSVGSNDDTIEEIHELWRDRGSEAEVESVVEQLFSRGLAWAAGSRQDAIERLPSGEPVTTSVALRKASGLLDTDPVAARKLYVTALIADPYSKRGVAWRLGDLSRTEDYVREATKWYSLALEAENDPDDQLERPRVGSRSSAKTTKKAAARTATDKSSANITKKSAAKTTAGKSSANTTKKAAAKTSTKRAPTKKTPTKRAAARAHRV